MSEPELVTLKVGGMLFEGWTTVNVSKGLRFPAGSFSLSYAERPSADGAPLKIRTGEACEVLIGGELVITGWIDTATPEFDAESRRLTVTGRDRTADLVDCAALNSPGSWANRTLLQIASDLVQPFGLTVVARTDVGAAFRRFSLQQGETVWDALERMARFRGFLVVSTPAGQIEFITPGRRRAGFTLRQSDMLSASAEHDVGDRFSLYVVKGQSSGDDESNGRAAAGPKAEVTDPAIKRYRPTLILAEEQATLASLQARAGWEANVRAAAGRRVVAEVQGWRDPDGALWSGDLIVPTDAPWLGIDGDILIADVSFELGESGSTTSLTLSPPDAYRPEPSTEAEQ
ncbi:phage baseplate assembly protein [Brevundimonas sp.]|uniref:phage baseplate assembly protein n=1 Tax=Brevundimonas sp. TaxID=1871086 RepID=UPI003F7040E3